MIDSTWMANLYRHYEQFPYWTEKREHPEMTLYESNSLLGAKVDLAQGDVARIDDLVFDSSNGRVLFVTVSSVPGWTGSSFAVPYRALSRKGENIFALGITKDKLVSARSFNSFEDLGSRGYALSVYRHFGISPSWTD
jgi:hypothetical protein